MHVMSATQQVLVGIGKAFDSKGNETTLDSTSKPLFSSSKPEVAAVVVSADGMSALYVGNLAGETQIQVEVDVLEGDAVQTITIVETLKVVPGLAVTVGLVLGEPEEQPATPPPPPVDPPVDPPADPVV